MPYCTDAEKAQARVRLNYPLSFGELNYLFTLEFIKLFRETPKYFVVHQILEHRNGFIDNFRNKLDNNMSRSHYETAFDLAFAEFYRRVVSKYEDKKAKENGDVYVEEGLLDGEGNLLV